MEKVTNFINKYGLLIVIFFSLIIATKTCSNGQLIREHSIKSEAQIKKLDSLMTLINTKALTKDDVTMLNNELMKEYNMLVFGIINNKISSDELTKKLKEIENGLIKIKNNNELKNSK